MIIDNHELQFHNPWWESKHLIREDKKLAELKNLKFKYYHPLLDHLPDEDVILTLRGPRRIGKTTLIKLMIKKLLFSKPAVSPGNILFYPCDTVRDYQELYQTTKEYLQATEAKSGARRFLFLDEISFVSEWQRAIKSLADSFLTKKATILITGSNIIDLTTSSERLPGRRGKIFSPDINFYPLTFRQFVQLVKPALIKQLKPNSPRLLPNLEALFKDYLITGGFPEIINEYYQKGFISSTFYETLAKWIEGDLHKAGKSSQQAWEIVKNIEKHQTTSVSYYKLAKESGLASHATIQDYLETLERMFVVFQCQFYSLDQKRTDIKKNKKIYFSDPFIRSTLIAQARGFLSEAFDYSRKVIFSQDNLPAIAEEVAAHHLKRKSDQLFYGQTQKSEIDFVALQKGKAFLYEVKYQKTVRPQVHWGSLRGEIEILTKSTLKTEKRIKYIPLSLFLTTFDNSRKTATLNL